MWRLKKQFFYKKTGPRRGARDRAGPAPHQVRDRPGGRGGRQHHGQVRHDAHRQVPRGHTATPGNIKRIRKQEIFHYSFHS